MNTNVLSLDKKDLATILAAHALTGNQVGVEIGVRGGEFSLMVISKCPYIKLFGIDPYTRVKGYRDITRSETFDRYEKEAHQKLDPFNNYHFVRKLSLEAVNDFEDESLDFVYIDANHGYDYVMEDIMAWIKKVRKGGIVCGDDYLRRKNSQFYAVVEAVNDFCDFAHIENLIIFRGEEVPQWMFIKK